VARIHAELIATNAAATVDAAIAELEARRAAPPFATASGPCTLPQLYAALSRRSGEAKKQRLALPAGAAAAAGGSAPA